MNILNTSKKFLKAGVCAIMLITAGQAQAQQVTVDASIDSLQLLIGEQAKVKLEISMDAKQKLQLPFLRDTLVKGVEILDIAKPDTQMLNDGKRMLIKQEYTITSFDSALYYLPPFEVMVNGEPYRSKALAVKVYSIPVDTLHPEQFFGPKTVREVPITWDDVSAIVWLTLLMLALGGLAYYLFVRYKDNKPIIKEEHNPEPRPHKREVKRGRFKFSMVGIKIGDYIIFDPTGVSVKVASDDSVEYQDRIYKLSPFVGTFMPEERRNTSGAYQGSKYFSFNGKVLDDMRKELETTSEEISE